MLTKEFIIRLLETDDRAVVRALLVLTARQTQDEQSQEQTRYKNGRGYRPCHAKMGASMTKFFERNGYLSPKQIAYWRSKDRAGNMRIGIYAGQLLEEAQAKSVKKSEIMMEFAAKRGLPVVNLPMLTEEERKELNRLEFALGDVLDSDDPKLVGPAKDELDAYMEKVRARK